MAANQEVFIRALGVLRRSDCVGLSRAPVSEGFEKGRGGCNVLASSFFALAIIDQRERRGQRGGEMAAGGILRGQRWYFQINGKRMNRGRIKIPTEEVRTRGVRCRAR